MSARVNSRLPTFDASIVQAVANLRDALRRRKQADASLREAQEAMKAGTSSPNIRIASENPSTTQIVALERALVQAEAGVATSRSDLDEVLL